MLGCLQIVLPGVNQYLDAPAPQDQSLDCLPSGLNLKLRSIIYRLLFLAT